MEFKEFRFSEATIKQRKRIIYTMIFCMPFVVFAVVYALIFRDGIDNLSMAATIFCGVVAVFTAEMLIITRIMFKKLRQSCVQLSNDRIVLQSGKYTDVFLFSDISSIHIIREKSGKLLTIRLTGDQKPMGVAGFEDMDEILGHIIMHLPVSVIRKEKTYKVDWNSPLVMLAVIAITSVVLISLLLMGDTVYQNFNTLFQAGFGLFFLLYKPLSRYTGSRFRLLEVLLGLLILTGALWQLLSKLL